MSKYEVVTIDCMVYEGPHRFIGVASVKLPDITNIMVELSGAGIGGKVGVPVSAQLEQMEVTINFNSYSKEQARLRAPGRHNIELRPAIQQEDTVRGEMVVVPEKHVMVVVPSGLTGATIAPASRRESSFKGSVRYWAHYIDGDIVHEIDQLNHVFIIDRVDYGAPVRQALGL